MWNTISNVTKAVAAQAVEQGQGLLERLVPALCTPRSRMHAYHSHPLKHHVSLSNSMVTLLVPVGCISGGLG